MKSRGLFFLFAIFCLLYVLNLLTPLLYDDYFLSFVWPAGAGINSLPDNPKKIESIFDVFESLKSYYLFWGGRIPGQAFMTFFAWKGKEYFNVVNALFSVLLVAEIYWISHEGKITLQFDASYLFWILFSLWTFNIAFVDTFLWLSGACEYLWMITLLLAFLIPYVQNYYNNDLLSQNELLLTVGMFLLGLIVGCSRETLVCWIILLLTYWLYSCKAKGQLQYWKIAGYVGLCIGYIILVFAPGNSARFETLELSGIDMHSYISVLSYKLPEIVLIIFFHFLLLYFVIGFFFKHHSEISHQKVTATYINVIKLSTLIALFTGILMFFIPSSGKRVSFISLCFLLIAAATIFRVQEKFSIIVIHKNAVGFIKKIGYFYFVLTVSVSLIGNYIFWMHWNNLLIQLKTTPKDTVIYVKPPLTENGDLWFFGSGMVHLIGMPVSPNEADPINLMIAKYYGVKGIKIAK